jgi:cytochrome c
MARVLTIAITALLAAAHATSAEAADPASGAKVFSGQCAVCHSAARTGPQSIGPHLFGVVGRRAGTLGGYNFSPAMKASGLIWTPEQLKRYLTNPAGFVRGNKMPFAGLHNASQLENLIAYLLTLH